MSILFKFVVAVGLEKENGRKKVFAAPHAGL